MDKVKFEFHVSVTVPKNFPVTVEDIESASLEISLKPDDYTIEARLLETTDIPDPSKKRFPITVEEGSIALLALNAFMRTKHDFTPLSYVDTQQNPWIFEIDNREKQYILQSIGGMTKSKNHPMKMAADSLATTIARQYNER